MAAGLLVHALLAQLLRPSEFGEISIALAFATFGATVLQAGLPHALIRALPTLGSLRDRGRMMALAIATTLALAVVCAVLIMGPIGQVLVASWDGGVPSAYLLYLAAMLPGFRALQLAVAESFRGLGDVARAELMGPFGSNSLLSLALLASLMWGPPAPLVAAIILCSTATVFLFGLLHLSRQSTLVLRGWTEVAGILFHGVGWVWGSSVLLVGTNTLDTLIAGSLLPNERVAVYAVAAKVAVVVAMPQLAVNAAVYPRLAQLWAAGDYAGFEAQARRAAVIATGWAAVIVATLGLVGSTAISLAFGSDFAVAAPFSVAIGAGQLVSAAMGPCSIVLLIMHREKSHLRATGISLAVLLVLAAVLGNQYGLWGIAISSGIATAAQNVLMATSARHGARTWVGKARRSSERS